MGGLARVPEETPSSSNAATSLPMGSAERVVFGPFSLGSHGAVLYRNNQPIHVGSRALHILAVLVARAGEVVSKANLLAEVWPGLTVTENNLTVQISALRQALGDGQDGARYIVNVPSRGYCFVAPVRHELESEGVPWRPPRAPLATNLPGFMGPMIGLSKPVEDVTRKLRASNLVTVVGPAGVGKTTLAVHVAQAEQSRHVDGVWLVELAPLREAEHIVPAIATAMRIELGPGDPTTTLIAVLSRTKALLLLDNCEHLIEPTTRLVATVLQYCQDVVLLTTSREPLRIGGEAIYSLAPLDVPPNAKKLSAREALAYPAVQMFVEQVGATTNNFTLLDRDAAAAAVICRRLDGLPLAIQFASPLVGTFGIAGLATRLDDRFKLIQTGIRGVPDRHRTLTTALDWSYGLLAESEQLVLRRLAIFVGPFTLEGAAEIVGVANPGELGSLLARLHTKSLITSYTSKTDLRFGLLETTRAFALEKLDQSGELDSISSIHAKYYANMLEFLWNNKTKLFKEGGYSSVSDQLGNVRAALKWSLSSTEHSRVSVKISAGAGLYFIELGLLPEAMDCAARALNLLEETERNTHHEMMLRYAHAYSLAVNHGNTDESSIAVKKSIELATLLKDSDLTIRVLGGYHMYLSRSGDNKAAMHVALQAAAVAEEAQDSDATAIAQALLSRSYHYAGDQRQAEACVRAVLGRLPLDRKVNTIRFGSDPRVRVLACHASILWLIGRPMQARACVGQFLEFSERLGDPIVAVQAAYAASILALQCGDWTWAVELIARLKEVALEYAIAPFPTLASALNEELLFRIDPSPSAEKLFALQNRFEAIRASGYNPAYHGVALIEGLTRAGSGAEAQALLNDLVADMRQKGHLLYMPEYLRLEGDILAAEQGEDSALAVSAYLRAFDLAREQSALAWELRAAISLARYYGPDASARAKSFLLPVYQQFDEGLDTADLMMAKQLLDTLA